MVNVNIYYSDEEVHDAFKNYYNEVKQYSNVHVFTKNAMPLSLYGEDENVFIYSTGGFWDKLKAWLAGEINFQQQFLKLNISQENSERYRTIINKGGIIIVSTQDESTDQLLNESQESNNSTLEEDLVPPTHSSIQNDEPSNTNVEKILEDIQTTDTVTTNFHEINESDHDDQSENSNLSFQTYSQANNPSATNDSTETNTHEENLYIADLNSSNQVPAANDEPYEYYEDGPRKHNLYSENLKQLISDYEQLIENDLNALNEKTVDALIDKLQNEASGVPEDILSLLSANKIIKEEILNSEQHQDVVQQDAAFNHSDEHPDITAHFVQQLSPDDEIRTFTINVISSGNVPTDSTESVLDYDLQTKLDILQSGEVKNPTPFNQEVGNEMNLANRQQKDQSTDETLEHVEDFENDSSLNQTSPENSLINLQDEGLSDTTEHPNHNDSP